jgi:hypothetical protein
VTARSLLCISPAFAAIFALHPLAFFYAETTARVFAGGGTLTTMDSR